MAVWEDGLLMSVENGVVAVIDFVQAELLGPLSLSCLSCLRGVMGVEGPIRQGLLRTKNGLLTGDAQRTLRPKQNSKAFFTNGGEYGNQTSASSLRFGSS